jgi:putative Mg2+ transporter-C (MgtC) family protein
MTDLTAFLSVTDISFPVVLVRLAASLVLGGLVGIERELHDQPAGFRTHTLICLGATMIMLLSIYVPQRALPDTVGGDPGRIAAQVVSGIGFLGAGAILRLGASVKGITTAASIWVVAALGLVIGAGMYGTAAVGTVFILFILTILGKIEKRVFTERYLRSLVLELATTEFQLRSIIDLIKRYRIAVQSSDISQSLDDATTKIRVVVKVPENLRVQELFHDLRGIPEIKKIHLKREL